MRRSKTPLALMEQLVMVLVFALAAALCVQVFVLSDRTSRYGEARDRALMEAQSAAEALKSGDETYFTARSAASGDGGWSISYDAGWNSVTDADAAAYHLLILSADSGLDYLWAAQVQVYTADGDLLADLPVAGQEVAGNG